MSIMSYFIRFLAIKTFTNSAITLTPIVAQNISRIVCTTECLIISETGSVRVTLAKATRMRVVALTNAALQIATTIALGGFAHVPLG